MKMKLAKTAPGKWTLEDKDGVIVATLVVSMQKSRPFYYASCAKTGVLLSINRTLRYTQWDVEEKLATKEAA